MLDPVQAERLRLPAVRGAQVGSAGLVEQARGVHLALGDGVRGCRVVGDAQLALGGERLRHGASDAGFSGVLRVADRLRRRHRADLLRGGAHRAAVHKSRHGFQGIQQDEQGARLRRGKTQRGGHPLVVYDVDALPGVLQVDHLAGAGTHAGKKQQLEIVAHLHRVRAQVAGDLHRRQPRVVRRVRQQVQQAHHALLALEVHGH